MTEIALDTRLQQDCHLLGRMGMCRLLLAKNAGVPWFILVPPTTVTELCDLDATEQDVLNREISALSRFIRGQFDVDKLNVAAIGNIVSQLHIHVVGRHRNDYCWPGVVWGTVAPAAYADDQIQLIVRSLQDHLEGFRL